MKKLRIILLSLAFILLATASKAQTEGFAELFLNKFTPEYYPITKICDDNNIFYIAHHYHSQDEYSLPESNLRRRQALSTNHVPAVFVMGNLLNKSSYYHNRIIDPLYYTYDSTDYTTDIYCHIDFVTENMVTPIATYTVAVEASEACYITVMLTENIDGFTNLVRDIITDPNGIVYTGEKLIIGAEWNNDFNIDNCKLVVVVEDFNRKVIGLYHNPITESMISGANYSKIDDDIKIYPNPSSSFINIESSRDMKEICVRDISGKLVEYANHIDNNVYLIDMRNYSKGVYFISVDNYHHKVILR
jgi:hypothetical protein